MKSPVKTHQQYLKKLGKFYIIPIGKYKGSTVAIKHLCLKCDFIFYISPDAVYKKQKNNQKCPNCNNINRLIEGYVNYKKELEIKDLKLLTKYKGWLYTCKHKCLKCNRIFYRTPNEIYARKHPCPKCNRLRPSARLTHKEYAERLEQTGKFKLLDKYEYSRKNIRVKCLKCNYIWNTRPLVALKHNCPVCVFNGRQNLRFKAKDYKLGNKIVQVQGWENIALDYILKNSRIKARDIKVQKEGKVPIFVYEWKGKNYRYYPDFYIQKKKFNNRGKITIFHRSR